MWNCVYFVNAKPNERTIERALICCICFVSISDGRVEFRLSGAKVYRIHVIKERRQASISHVAAIGSTYGRRSCISHERYVENAAATTNNPSIGRSDAIFGFNSRYAQRRLDRARD